MRARIVAFLIVGLILAPGLASAEHAASASSSSGGATPVFQFADGVSDEDRAYVVEGFRLAQDFDRKVFDAQFQESVTFEVGPKPGATYRGFTQGHTVTFVTDHHVWLDSSPIWRLKAPTHESFHVLQNEWAKRGDKGPIWLLEGSAEYVAWQAMAGKGLVDFNAVRDRWVQSTLNGAVAGVPLEDMASSSMPQAVRCCLYEVAPLAVEQLVAGPGIRSLRAYYEAIGTGTPWETAFASAFGQTPEAFYAAFASARAQLAPLGYDLTSVRFPAPPVEGAADVAFVSAPSPIKRGEQALLTGATAPGIGCALTITSAKGKRLLVQPTHAGPDGTVFWLWSVSKKAPKGTATVAIECGASPATVSIEVK